MFTAEYHFRNLSAKNNMAELESIFGLLVFKDKAKPFVNKFSKPDTNETIGDVLARVVDDECDDNQQQSRDEN